MGKSRVNKYNDEVKEDTKKDEVPEGYKKIEVKPAEMPTYKNPDDKSVKMPVYKNPDDKSVKMPKLNRKKYIIVPKDSSKIKEFNEGGEQIMDENYRTKNKYKIQKGSKKRGRNIYHVSTEYLKDESKSKGGQIKTVKAVAGVLAGMAAGIAPGIIGLGYMANKRAKKKAKATAQAQAGMAESTIQPIRTLNRGGGMDMGHKPRPRGNPGIVENVVGKGSDYIKDLID